MPPRRLRSASRLCGGTRPCCRATTLAVALTVPTSQMGLTSLAERACEAQSCYPVNSCGAPVTDDEKPKRTRSWREIDKMRDRSGGSTRRDTRERERFENSTGYTKYKTNLDRLFTGGGATLPEHLREKQDPAVAERDEE